MSYVILFPRLEVSGANAMPAWWFIGPPSPTAYVGFAQSAALKCLPVEHQDCFCGVGVVLHDYRLQAEKLPGMFQHQPHQFRAAALINNDDYASGSKSLSLQPSARCDLTVSLSLVFTEDAPVVFEKLDRFMRNARVAGGIVEANGPEPIILDNMAEVKSRLKTGFALHSRPDLMIPVAGEDALDALLRATIPTTETRKENPWVMPATLGYTAVTDISERIWNRDGHPHAFAEPLVGLVQLKSLKDSFVPVWKFSNPAKNVFLVEH